MRRKSERNKAKASPEKKVERVTRKSTRRRAKKSPSTSPEREVEAEAVSSTPSVKEEEEKVSQVAIGESEEVKRSEENVEENVNSSPEEVNEESVWKVARADASPGEIQKLKLCRQRNVSEASSEHSLERKKNELESGERPAEEEDDPAEEPPVAAAATLEAHVDEQSASAAPPCGAPEEDSCSRHSGERSSGGEPEVSDSKESPPETTSADLSDAMQNADREQPPQQLEADDSKANADQTPVTIECSVTDSTANNLDQSLESEQAPATQIEDDQRQDNHLQQREQTSDKENEENDDKDNASDQEKSRHSDSSSNHEDEKHQRVNSQSKLKSSVMMTRRKHRDKYHDSSNSDSNESDDEQEDRKQSRDKMSPRHQAYDECNDKPKSPEEEQIDTCRSHIQNTQQQRDDDEESQDKDKDKQQNSYHTDNNKDDHTANETVTTMTAHKPTKVNLKRSFTRITDVAKKDSSEKKEDGETAENKENCAIEIKSAPKRRRWGTTITSDIAPTFSVSTDTLKALVPEAKPLSLNEVRLSKDDDVEERKPRERTHSVNNSVETQKSKEESGRKSDAMDNYIGKRKISIVKDLHTNSPSPPAVKPTNILLIKNLVRPFTLNQIKELLSRTGKIVENGFWMDRIKSKCFVEYANEDQAFETRQALHGISWPLTNPKKLHVEYATKEDIQEARESSKDLPMSRRAETVSSSDTWQHGWTQDEKNNSTKVTVIREWDLGKEDGQVHPKEKDKEKKDIKKKRASPSAEAHLPPPARKFKKKEDEPPPAKLLDDLFRKTKATPCIYWLPLTNEQIAIKKEMRRQHMVEHARRLEEMRRVKRNRDRDRRRRSPRKY